MKLDLILYLSLWAYQTSVRNITKFTPFQLVYGLEAILPIQCEISSLKLAIDLVPDTSEEETYLLNLVHIDETRHEAQLANEAHKRHIKAQIQQKCLALHFLRGQLGPSL